MDFKDIISFNFGPFKKEIKSSEIAAMYKKVNIDQFFDNLSYYYNPSELIRELGGVRKLPDLLKDTDTYAAVDKRLSALLDTKLAFEGKDQGLVDFFTDQIVPHEDQLKEDFWFTIFYGHGVEQIIYDPKGTKNVLRFEREDFWRFTIMPNLYEAKVKITSNPDLIDKVLPWGKWVVTNHKATKSK